MKQLLEDLDLTEIAEQLREEIAASKGQKRAKLIKRLRDFVKERLPDWKELSFERDE